MSEHNLPLGQQTEYPKAYTPELLVRIPRDRTRAKLLDHCGEAIRFSGYDLWTLYELSWLSLDGTPRVAIAEFKVPSSSAYIVESKSLKLYINSLCYLQADSNQQVEAEIQQQLSECLGISVGIKLYALNDIDVLSLNTDSKPDLIPFIDLDALGVAVPINFDNGTLTSRANDSGSVIYKTDLFRSLCPVTGQPDWASIYVGLSGTELSDKSLAAYLLSYREHQGFHESCVEQIFADLLARSQPKALTVAARFTRRGGIDINPYRTTDQVVFDMPGRTKRQ